MNKLQSTGLRAQILIIDDLLKDDSESYNVALHKKMEDRYESTWSSRADGDGLKVLLMGTMWANTDLLNIMYERAREKEDLVPSNKFKYTEITKSGSSVFIGIPALDENDHSTCPLRYSDEFLKDKRYRIKLDYGAFPERPYDSPGVWGDPTLINDILARAGLS